MTNQSLAQLFAGMMATATADDFQRVLDRERPEALDLTPANVEQWTAGSDGCGKWAVYIGSEKLKGWSGQGKCFVSGLSEMQARKLVTQHELDAAYEVAQLKPAAMDRNYLALMAKAVEAHLTDQHCFIVFAFSSGPDARMYYTSNARREDAINSLKECLIKASGPEEWLKHLQ